MAIGKVAQKRTATGYRGKQAKTGNSLGLRFDKALFQSHPEFSGEVRAHVIAPGRLLVVAESRRKTRGPESDPVLEAFLGFLAADMTRSPQQIRPLDKGLAQRMNKLVGKAQVDPHEDLGGDSLV
ncbi:MAG: type II toxin-antitoxin system PrlF family antitoxin [Acidobacteriaceae bacterium]|nr:type II toxin-antitoxin system PrlF family antitoxin [Acidobacteriaceae bacterium]MBV9294419.1 type II toxin-antitoxin system PrlF family antitoxin [Acidobacteriaceae bacterium]MBV9767224.1 type II toxin-antitoxin system PrlF family antitoxin [Acidobacteriaceae bacterium]